MQLFLVALLTSSLLGAFVLKFVLVFMSKNLRYFQSKSVRPKESIDEPSRIQQ